MSSVTGLTNNWMRADATLPLVSRTFSGIPPHLGLEIMKLKLPALNPQKLLSLSLEKAEIEVFSVAKEKGYSVLTDDVHAARVFFEKTKITAQPSFYLLLLLYQKKRISKEHLIEDIATILHYRNWLSGALWDYALRLIEEMD